MFQAGQLDSWSQSDLFHSKSVKANRQRQMSDKNSLPNRRRDKPFVLKEKFRSIIFVATHFPFREARVECILQWKQNTFVRHFYRTTATNRDTLTQVARQPNNQKRIKRGQRRRRSRRGQKRRKQRINFIWSKTLRFS